MPPRLFPYAFLILSLAIINTIAIQDLRYYQNLHPGESAEEITFKQLERLLKLRNQNAGYESRHSAPGLEDLVVAKERDELRELERSAAAAAEIEKEFKGPRRILQDVLSSERSNLIHPLPKRRPLKHVPNYPGSPLVDGLEDAEIRGGYSAPRDPRESHSIFHAHGGYNRPLIPAAKPHVIPKYEAWYGPGNRSPEDIWEQGMKEEPLSGFYGKYLSHGFKSLQHYSREGQADYPEEPKPDFTYKFDEPNNVKEQSDFGLRPNDPGYDLDDARVLPKAEEKSTIPSEDGQKNSNELAAAGEQSLESSNNGEEEDEGAEELDDVDEEENRSAVERRADSHSPTIKAVDHKISNNIYFIAVAAGCSAAVMFLLVLISLTWCRFQRGAKAAADVEYPAYGVTGPNKDTSPSGDRRLAQSAQMYHYQHQKQQIIAMESRTATARDPGSVSEAESDEENEEGDYTVYECPGLAPTGEMEVKNPLFHDDPTPATPAAQLQGHKSRSSEDQM